ncbi:hypothetical protein EV174_005067 [Coemansia sp. RSA 2320]|nr:hypothetical protein EV174_005067 [Coemansia sp. RSA 2320]
MTSTRRRSTGGSDEEGALTEQIGHLGLSEPRSGADTPGWLPRIVSVCSPPETTPMAYRKQRAASDQELDTQIRRASADPHLRNARGPSTPTSAPIAPALIEEGVAFTYQVPDSPLSTRSAGAITSTAPPVTAAAAAAMPGSRMPTIVAPTATLSAVEPRTSPGAANALATSKWIKRKSRIMPSTRFSVAPQGLVQAIAEDDEEEAAGDPVKTPTLGVEDGLAAMQARSTSQSSHAATLSSATAVSAAAGAAGESKSSKRRRENYGQLEEYAEGESGNVYITTWTGTGKRPKGDYVAVKVVPKAAKARYRKLRTELKILRRIRSQHVVRFYEYFSIDDSVWIIYEFMGRGSITDLLAGYPEIRMPAVTIAYAMHEVLTALAYLHERHIVHCDVRSDNVLVDERGQVKLADFSSAVYLDADQAAAQKASLGAIYWMAPELARGAGYSGATDVWAAGALLYEMIEGQPPYIEYPDIKVLELAHANGLPRVDPGDACDPRLVDLMRLCTVVAPGERLAASKLRKHEAVAAPNVAQCAQLMVDFVLQVESLEEGESELGGESE